MLERILPFGFRKLANRAKPFTTRFPLSHVKRQLLLRDLPTKQEPASAATVARSFQETERKPQWRLTVTETAVKPHLKSPRVAGDLEGNVKRRRFRRIARRNRRRCPESGSDQSKLSAVRQRGKEAVAICVVSRASFIVLAVQ